MHSTISDIVIVVGQEKLIKLMICHTIYWFIYIMMFYMYALLLLRHIM